MTISELAKLAQKQREQMAKIPAKQIAAMQERVNNLRPLNPEERAHVRALNAHETHNQPNLGGCERR